MTSEYMKRYEEVIKSIEDLLEDTLLFMLNPVRDESVINYVKISVAKRAVPENDWLIYGQPVMFPWMIDSLIPEDIVDKVRAMYYKRFQLYMYGEATRLVLRGVRDTMITHPFKLSSDRILTRIAGCVTDTDIVHFDKYTPKMLTKNDYKECISMLIKYKYIPVLFREAIDSIASDMISELNFGINQPVLIVSSPIIVDEIVETGILPIQDIKLIPEPVFIQGDYTDILGSAIEYETSSDKFNRPAVVHIEAIEMDCLKGFPGSSMPGFLESSSIKDLVRLGESMNNMKCKWVSALGIGDAEDFERFIVKIPVELCPNNDYDNYDICSHVATGGTLYNDLPIEKRLSLNPNRLSVIQAKTVIEEYIEDYKNRVLKKKRIAEGMTPLEEKNEDLFPNKRSRYKFGLHSVEERVPPVWYGEDKKNAV